MKRKRKYLKSIRAKILLSILMITLLTLLAVTLIFYRQSARAIEDHYIVSLQQRAEQMMDGMDEDICRVYHTNLYASCDSRLKEDIRLYRKAQREGYLEELAGVLREYKGQSSMISSIYLLIPETGTVVTSEDYPVYRKEIPADRIEAVRQMAEEDASPLLMEDLIYEGETLFSCVEEVKDGDGELLGYMMSNTNESKLYYDYLAGWKDKALTEAVMLDSRKRIVSDSEKRHMGNLYEKGEEYQEWLNGEETVGSDGRNIYIYLRSSFTDTGLFAVVDRTVVLGDLQWIRWFFFGILAVFLAVALLLALYLSKLIYRPLKKLTLAMKGVSEGNLHLRVQIDSGDEIEELAGEFNKMLDRIEDLIGQVILEEDKKKDMELEALQYQITPHFMYNTLNSIKFAAFLKGDTEIGQVIGDFVELLQAAISKKGGFLTVEEEVRILKKYIRLQEFRYGTGFQVSYEVEEDAKDCLVPRLILQPLAENALLHGLDMKKDGGTLKICAAVNGERLFLRVADNGRGMSRDQIERLLNSKVKKERGFTAVGIPNICDRLKLYYGEQGGITYESSENGTTAIVFLPVRKDEDER